MLTVTPVSTGEPRRASGQHRASAEAQRLNYSPGFTPNPPGGAMRLSEPPPDDQQSNRT